MWEIIRQVDVATIVAICIFILGFIITGIINKANKRIELKLYKQLIVSWTESTKSSIDLFISKLQEFAIAVSQNESLNIAKYEHNLITFQRLNSLPIEKIADVLTLNIKIKRKGDSQGQATKMMYRYISQIEYIEACVSKITEEYYKSYVQNSKNVMDEWNKNFIALKNSLTHRRLHRDYEHASERERHFYDLIEIQFVKLQMQHRNANGEVPMSLWDSDFIQTSMDSIEANLREDVNLLESALFVEVSTHIAGLQLSYMQHIANKGFGRVFLEMSNNMQKAENDIFESIKYFKEHRLRRILYIK